MEKILLKANELGHLLAQHEIVRRYRELAGRLDGDEAAAKLLEGLMELSQRLQAKEEAGEEPSAEEQKELAEMEEAIGDNDLIGEFLATQTYYMQMIAQVNELISNPQGQPPRDSGLIVPGSEGGRGLVMP